MPRKILRQRMKNTRWLGLLCFEYATLIKGISTEDEPMKMSN